MDYELDSNQNSVNLWSDQRLPFEPKGEVRQMRDALRERLCVLKGQSLTASFGGSEGQKFDIENVLFYNVGCSAFRKTAVRALRFERHFEVPLSTSGRIWRWHHRYSTGSSRSTWRHSTAGTEFTITGEGELPSSAAEYWMAAHLARTGGPCALAAGPLFLRLRLRSLHPVNLTDAVKKLTDGVCSALHCYAGLALDAISERVSARLNLEPGVAIEWFARQGPLGPAAFVWPYRADLQWSPADERLVAVEFTWSQSPANAWTIDVGLYEASQHS